MLKRISPLVDHFREMYPEDTEGLSDKTARLMYLMMHENKPDRQRKKPSLQEDGFGSVEHHG